MENLICNKELSVVQANELIRSKQDSLTLLEAKLIKLAISQIVMEDTDLKTYKCKATELADFLGIDQKTIYRDLETLANSILKKVISIKDKSKPKRNGQYNYKLFHWVDYFEYYNGNVTIKISEELKPYLLGLDALFTKYGYDSILGLPTSNAIRLFELLSSYESLTNPYSLRNQAYTNPYPHIQKESYELIFSVEYLRKYFNCTEKYPNTNHFIQYVIDISVKGINKNNPTMRVSYRTAKEGRSIGYVLFKINAWSDNDFLEFIKE